MSNATGNAPAISVVVPLFNEEENVPILQSQLEAALSGLDYEIIFVDDGSSDQTVNRIVTQPRIRILRFEKTPDKAPRCTPARMRLGETPSY